MTLTLHRPDLSELHHRQAWMLDPEMMSYNVGWPAFDGYHPETGCIDWPEENWQPFVDDYLDGDPTRRAYYYLRDGDEFVGHVHYQLDDAGEAAIGFNVVPSRRGEGLGREALDLLIERVWADTPAGAIVNEFEEDRTPAVRVHRAAGFRVVRVHEDYGRPVAVWVLERP